MVYEPAARFHMESELMSFRNVMWIESHRARGCLYTAVHINHWKNCTAGNADSRCERSLRHTETTDILAIALFVVYQDIWSANDTPYKVKMLRWTTDNPDFLAQFIFFVLSDLFARGSHRSRRHLIPEAPCLFAFFIGTCLPKYRLSLDRNDRNLAPLGKATMEPQVIDLFYPEGAPHKRSVRNSKNVVWENAGKYHLPISAGLARVHFPVEL